MTEWMTATAEVAEAPGTTIMPFGARESFDIPVVGPAEAAMLTAGMMARRFAILTFARALGPWYEGFVAMHGLRERCADAVILAGAPSTGLTHEAADCIPCRSSTKWRLR